MILLYSTCAEPSHTWRCMLLLLRRNQSQITTLCVTTVAPKPISQYSKQFMLLLPPLAPKLTTHCAIPDRLLFIRRNKSQKTLERHFCCKRRNQAHTTPYDTDYAPTYQITRWDCCCCCVRFFICAEINHTGKHIFSMILLFLRRNQSQITPHCCCIRCLYTFLPLTRQPQKRGNS